MTETTTFGKKCIIKCTINLSLVKTFYFTSFNGFNCQPEIIFFSALEAEKPETAKP